MQQDKPIDFPAMFPYRTPVTARPYDHTPMSRWLNEQPWRWHWMATTAAPGGTIMFRCYKHKALFEIACSEYVA